MKRSRRRKSRRRALVRRVFRCLEHVFALIGLGLLVFHLGFDLSVMASPSMSPTLRGTAVENGDWLLAEKLSYCFRSPRRWEVVAFRNGEGNQVMKRVVGLPGETVSLQDKRVTIDGSIVPRPASLDHLKYYAYGDLHRGKSVECGDGWYVLGDASRDSQDSRFTGPLARDRIRGRAWLVVWPPSRLGFVNP